MTLIAFTGPDSGLQSAIFPTAADRLLDMGGRT
jgi:hypothetical protein